MFQYISTKFGLKDCCLDNLLWNVFWMTRSLTVNIDSKSDFRASVFHYAFNFVCLISYLYCYVFCAFYTWGWIYPINKDRTAIVIIISLYFSSNISTMKLAYLFQLRKELTTVIDAYRTIDATVDVDSRYGRSMLQGLKTIKKRSLIFWTSFVGGSIVYLCLPLVAPGNNFPENSLHLYGLEPKNVSPNYGIAYTINLLAGVTATLVPVNVTVLLVVLVGYIEAHIIALTKEFHNIWQDAVASVEDIDNVSVYRNVIDQQLNEFVKARLNFLVSRHGECVMLMKKVSTLFEGAIAFEFALTMIALCAVLLGGLEDTFLQIPYTIIQLVVDSLVGQRLLDAGSLYERSIYECGWEHFNSNNMKTIQVILQCSQKPLRLTAGGVTTLGFASFMSITKSVYSAYATLRKTLN